MTDQTFPDEILMSYADGELDDETARALEAALAEDEALTRRLALFTGTGDALAALRKARPVEPAPDALTARVRDVFDRARVEAGAKEEAEKVVPFTPPAPPPVTPKAANRNWRPMAIAASLALAVGLGAGFGAGRMGGEPAGVGALALLNDPGMPAALSELESGQGRALTEGEITVVASFRTAEGVFCREFNYERSGAGGVVSVACHEKNAWSARLAIAAPAPDESGYAPASAMDTLENYLSDIGAGPALTEDEEIGALDQLGG